MLNTSSGAVSKEQWPNLFIIGAAKSGTSSLADYLGQHPDIFISRVKEPYYFVPDFGLTSKDEYLRLFAAKGNVKLWGEASTGYIWSRSACVSIKEHSPEAKIIVLLRNPIDMAFSLWQFMVRQGNERMGFSDAFDDDVHGKRSAHELDCVGWPDNYLYYRRALYFDQIRNCYDVFGKENVMVYSFEEFKNDTSQCMKNIFLFLGVNEDFVPDTKIVNEGGGARFRFLQVLNQQQYPLLKRFLPVEMRDYARSFVRKLNVNTKNKLSIDPEVREKYKIYYKNDVLLLESMLGRQLWPEYSL